MESILQVFFSNMKPSNRKEVKTFVGLDFSMHELYVDSEGIYANYPKYYRQEQLKLAREQRKFSKMEKEVRIEKNNE